MVVCRRWRAALSIATEVGANYSELTSQEWCDRVPHQMGLWKAVQEQKRWPIAVPAHEYARFLGLDFSSLERIEHRTFSLSTQMVHILQANYCTIIATNVDTSERPPNGLRYPLGVGG